MAVSENDIQRLRRMIAERDSTTYTDSDLSAAIALHPCVDAHGQAPYVWTAASDALAPPTRAVNPVWVETYDLNYTAADLWSEKAANVAHLYDFSADGGNYQRSQMVEQAQRMVNYYLARRNPSTIKLAWAPQGVQDDSADVD